MDIKAAAAAVAWSDDPVLRSSELCPAILSQLPPAHFLQTASGSSSASSRSPEVSMSFKALRDMQASKRPGFR